MCQECFKVCVGGRHRERERESVYVCLSTLSTVPPLLILRYADFGVLVMEVMKLNLGESTTK